MKKTFSKIKKSLGLALVCAYALLSTSGEVHAQCNVVLNPVADSYVFSRTNPSEVNNNFGTVVGLPVGTWTWNGNQGSVRTFLRFDLTGIPANATITAATLNLNANVNWFIAGGHQSLGGGSNAAIVHPVSAAWGETTITWNNQPGVGAASVAMAQSTTNNQNYSVNVLAMVQTMVTNPANNFGFRVRQNAEAIYGILTFGSRENGNAALRPTLNVTYTAPTPTPTFVTTPPSTVCTGTAIDYSVNAIANANNYTWRVDGVQVSSGATPTYSRTWTAGEIGNRVVTVTASACGTTSTALTHNVTVVAPPTVAAITGNTTVCVNQYTPLSNATPGGSWSSSDAGVATVNSFGLVQGISAGTATIYYTVANAGCSTVVNTTVTVNGTVTFVINGPSTVCPNTTGNAYSVSPAVGGADYTWNIQDAPGVGVNFPVNGSTNTTLSIPSGLTGQFTLRCQGLNACGASQIVSKLITVSTDVPPLPIITCSGGSGCPDLVVANYGVHSIEWIVGGVVQGTSPTFTRPLSTPILCTYTSASGCKASTWYSPAVVCTYAARLAKEIELPADKPFLIYPNPTNGVFAIQTKNQLATATIYDIAGRVVREIELTEMQNLYTIEIGTPGMYTIRIETATDTKGFQIVVE